MHADLFMLACTNQSTVSYFMQITNISQIQFIRANKFI